jgi:hypothetical protein
MKIKPIHSIKCDGLPVQVLLDNEIVEPRDYKKTFGRNRYRTIYKYTAQFIKES